MKKTVLFIFTCLLAIGNVSAQWSVIPYDGSEQQLRSTQADVTKFGYSAGYIYDGIGMGSGVTLSAAICIPNAKFGFYAGKTITAINIGLKEPGTNVSVWVRSDLDGSNLAIKEIGNVGAGWNEVVLDSPVMILEEDIYIGYTVTGAHPIGVSGATEYEASWLCSPNYGWENMQQSDFGSLCIQAYIDMLGASLFDLGIKQLNTSQITTNEYLNIEAILQSISSENEIITSIKYAYEINGQEPVEKTISTHIAPNSTTPVNLQIEQMNAAGVYQVKITILEVNGRADDFMPNNSAVINCVVTSQLFPKKVVVEEGTGTWCQFCPRGMVGMEMMKEKYPETFIGIAVHSGDIMAVNAYEQLMAPYFSGFPTCVANRKMGLIGDPYYDIERIYLLEMAIESPVGIKLSGAYVDESKEVINLTTTSTFGFSAENVNYHLSYVLIENEVTGTESGYTQVNYYSGGEPMGGYENKPLYITDQVYDDVARDIHTVSGVSNNGSQSIAELTPVIHNYTITLPTSILNKDNVEVIVMLLDENNEIVNADKIELDGMTVGINSVSVEESTLLANVHKLKESLNVTIKANDVVTISLYNVNGQLISSEIKSIKDIETVSLPIEGLNGIYLLKVQTKNKVSTNKVVL